MTLCGFIREVDSRTAVYRTPFLPTFSFYEVHESSPIQADARRIISVVEGLDMRDDRVANVLLSAREIPSRLAALLRKQRHDRPSARFGFDTFTLLCRDDHEISRGLVGRFWRPDLGIAPIADAAEFQHSVDPTAARLVLRFKAIAGPNDTHILRTETFVYCPTTRTKFLFAPYWLAIRVASGWIRRRTLASVQSALATGDLTP
ncbi:hypothetical protein RI103_10050 [Paraburkholderia sp. FT54]|uniref:hypothetical protein n=1 Tax=Paraburkholderia sp. FT54 TaxID=3074437 RepID=UPI0028775062|nr:hypothetical protein [Paraburkholderia sp. FT54]WNC91694.1 hypothetical protein RI103_10050 [Paraburkholderia sp. FT54]